MARRSTKGRPVNGILLLDKSLGLSSNMALQTAKRLYQANKAGHTGSLDPLASGMLPLCFGEATKISAFLLDSDKEYVTDAHLGIKTSTGDREGEVADSKPVPELTEHYVLETLKKFIGPIVQIPPMHSALKKDGKPLYKLARKGLEIERAERHVVIHGIELLNIVDDVLTLRVRCSKGTYIRTLVEDIGEAFDCCAHVSRLHRTSVDPFDGLTMFPLETLKQSAESGLGALDDLLLPLDRALSGLPFIHVSRAQQDYFCAGRIVDFNGEEIPVINESIRIYGPGEHFIGLGQINEKRELKPKRVFNL